MSGRNILLILIAALAVVGVYYLLAAPTDRAAGLVTSSPVASPKPAAPGPAKDRSLQESAPGERSPTDLVAEDAARTIDEIKQQQAQEMMQKTAAPDMSMEKVN